MMEDGGEHMAQPHSFSICTRGISSKSYISQKDRVSLHHLGIAPETLRAELTHFAYEHSVQRLTYLPQRTSLLGAANTRQVLQHYVAFSNKNDVSYYFNDTSCDWRVKHLVPMCLKASDTGLVLSSLFVSLHRLRNDHGSTAYATLYFNDAVATFRSSVHLHNKPIEDLACILMFLQHDVTMNHGRNLDIHLAAAGKIFSGLEDRLHSEDADVIECLLTVHQLYDLLNSLLTGKEPTFTPRMPSTDLAPRLGLSSVSLSTEDLWTIVHSIWSQVLPGLSEIHSGRAGYVDWSTVISQLKHLSDLFESDDRYKPVANPLSIYCPVGTCIAGPLFA